MAWPLSQDYNEAIQSPASVFADADLRQGEPVCNAMGLPMPRSGNFADVYEFHSPQGRWAIKCFTREIPNLHERYRLVSDALQRLRLPFTVDFQFLEQGIRIRGQWYPILKMQWVDGFLLNEFVRDNLDKPQLLEGLSAIWVRMAQRLREAGIAHADIQHGNVILVPGSKASSLAVKLIDYDGMFVPELEGTRSSEVGHPNFQHPTRIREGLFDADVDRFAILTVACALRALSVGGQPLWDRYDNGDNLLFRESDFRNVGKSPVFKELWNSPDTATRTLVGYLAMAVNASPDQCPFLEELMPDNEAIPLSQEQEVWLDDLFGGSTRVSPKAMPMATLVAVPVPPSDPADFTALETSAPQQVKPKRRSAQAPPAAEQWSPRRIVLAGVAVAVAVFVVSAGVMLLRTPRDVPEKPHEKPIVRLLAIPPLDVQFGETAKWPIKIQRDHYDGPVKCVLVNVTGATWQPITIGSGEVDGAFSVAPSIAVSSDRVLSIRVVAEFADAEKTESTARLTIKPRAAPTPSEKTDPPPNPVPVETKQPPPDRIEALLATPTANNPSDVRGQLASDDPRHRARNNPSKTYPIDLKAGKDYVVELSSSQFDPYLFVESPSGIQMTTGGGQTVPGIGVRTVRHQVQPRDNGRYRLVVTASAFKEGAFTLRVAEALPAIVQPPPAKKPNAETTNGIGMKLVSITSGKFLMGSPRDEEHRQDDEVQHEVEITKGFWLGKYEVTQAEFASVMGNNPSQFRGLRLPVENVSWADAKEFCRKLSEKEGKDYRLPTEAEWEYACRAGTMGPFSTGNDLTAAQANFNSPAGEYRAKTTPAGSFAANPFGLCDMHGNTWEWCEDWHGAYEKAPGIVRDPKGPLQGSSRVFRGGGWSGDAKYCRSASRGKSEPATRRDFLGFRVAMRDVAPNAVANPAPNPVPIPAPVPAPTETKPPPQRIEAVLMTPTARIPSEVRAQLTLEDPRHAARNNPAKTYAMDLKAGKKYVVELSSTQFDTYLVVETATGAKLAANDDRVGDRNSRLPFQPPVDGRYHLIVTAAALTDAGAFTLKVSELPSTTAPPPAGSTDGTLSVTIRKIDGNKVTFVKYSKDNSNPEQTLQAIDNVKVVRIWLDTDARKVIEDPIAGGLRSDELKAGARASIVVADNRISTIRLIAGKPKTEPSTPNPKADPKLEPASKDGQFYATIRGIDGNKITYAKGSKDDSSLNLTLMAADNVKVVRGVFDSETKKVVEGEPIAAGLRSDELRVGVRVQFTVVDNHVVAIRISPAKKK